MTHWPLARRAPQPPEDVQIILRGGRRIPAECAYRGRTDDGLHEWVVTAPVDLRRITEITCAVLPAKTTIIIEGPGE